jgi:hypothetical protein
LIYAIDDQRAAIRLNKVFEMHRVAMGAARVTNCAPPSKPAYIAYVHDGVGQDEISQRECFDVDLIEQQANRN